MWSAIQVVYSRVGSWPNPQTLDLSGKACHGQTLQYITIFHKLYMWKVLWHWDLYYKTLRTRNVHQMNRFGSKLVYLILLVKHTSFDKTLAYYEIRTLLIRNVFIVENPVQLDHNTLNQGRQWRERLSMVDLVLTSLDQLLFIIKILIWYLTKQATLFRRSTELRRPP